MKNAEQNFWSEFEYSKFKLLLNTSKVESILKVIKNEQDIDKEFPLSIALHLTNNCNLKCRWCIDKNLRNHNFDLDKNYFFDFFEQLADKNVGITIEGGGEPSAHRDFHEIITYAHSKNIPLGLITNNVSNISDLVNKFKWIRVSLDASNQSEYIIEKGVDKFKQVLSNIENLAKKRDPLSTHLGIGYVLTDANFSELLELIHTMDRYNVDYFYIRPVEGNENILLTKHNLIKLKKKIIDNSVDLRIKIIFNLNGRLIKNNKGLPCVAHSLTCLIRANGDVLLCSKREHDLITLGNIKEQSFRRIWNSNIRKKVSKDLLKPKNQIGCKVCRISSFNELFFNIRNIHTSSFI